MIAPYWSNVDTRCGGGHIYYRQLNLIPGSDLSKKIHNDIARSGYDIFLPTSVVIVTWKEVTPSCGDDRVMMRLVIRLSNLRLAACNT